MEQYIEVETAQPSYLLDGYLWHPFTGRFVYLAEPAFGKPIHECAESIRLLFVDEELLDEVQEKYPASWPEVLTWYVAPDFDGHDAVKGAFAGWKSGWQYIPKYPVSAAAKVERARGLLYEAVDLYDECGMHELAGEIQSACISVNSAVNAAMQQKCNDELAEVLAELQ